MGPHSRWGIATCDNTLGLIAASAGDPARARTHFEAARATRRQLVEQSPTVHIHRSGLTATCLNLARHYGDYRDPVRAAEAAREACAQADELVQRDPVDIHFRSQSVRAYRLAAGAAEAQGDLAAARLRARSAELLAGFTAGADAQVWRPLAHDAVEDGLGQLRWGHWRAALRAGRLFCGRRVEDNLRHRIVTLEAENQRLRDEVERLRRGGPSPETFTPVAPVRRVSPARQ